MTDADIQLIERNLRITLPSSYKQAVVPFQIPALAGNTECELWDDANRLVKLNEELRQGSRFRLAWPPHFFAVGDPHGDELIAIDLRAPDAHVWWLDHGLIESKASYQSHARFNDWVDEFYRATRSDLKGDDYDPEGTPKTFEKRQRRAAWEDLMALLLMAGLIVLAIVAFAAIKSWLKRH